MGSDRKTAFLVPLGMNGRRAALGAAVALPRLLDGEAGRPSDNRSADTRSRECRTRCTVSWWTWLSSEGFLRNFKSANHVHVFQDPIRSTRMVAFGIDLGDEQRSAVAEDVIVVRALAGVDEVERVGMGHPVGLRVVGAEVGAVVPGPFLEIAEVQPILADGDIAGVFLAQRQEILALEDGQRRFGQAALEIAPQRVADLQHLELDAVEGAAQHRGAGERRVLLAMVDGQQDGAVRQIHALAATGAARLAQLPFGEFERRSKTNGQQTYSKCWRPTR